MPHVNTLLIAKVVDNSITVVRGSKELTENIQNVSDLRSAVYEDAKKHQLPHISDNNGSRGRFRVHFASSKTVFARCLKNKSVDGLNEFDVESCYPTNKPVEGGYYIISM